MSKTPQFDKALDEHFSNLKLDEKGSQWRTCRFSGQKFYVRPQDIGFYKKIHLPLPTKHPWQRIMERSKREHDLWLYPFKCPKCGEQTHTVYSPEQQKELKIYCEKCYLQEVV